MAPGIIQTLHRSAGQNLPARPSRSFTSMRAVQWPNEDAGWLITLSDLTLLLLAILVLWYVNDKRMTTPKISQSPVDMESRDTPIVRREQIDPPDNLVALQHEMRRHIEALGMSEHVRIETAPNEIVVSLKDSVPFPLGKANLRPQALPVLDKVSSMALGAPELFLEVSGHTDNLPIATAEFPSNWELSAARSSRVARYLIEKGVAALRISVQGFANQRPRVPNSSAVNRETNRRVEIRLYRSGGSVQDQRGFD